MEAGVDVLVPTGLAEVHEGLHRIPGARLLAGGTDLLVDLRKSSSRPPAVLSVGQVPELRGWRRRNGLMDLGAAVTFTELAESELADAFPALGTAARVVAGPQIRNAATIGGNLATAASTSDLIPVFAALDATAVIEGADGRRELRIGSAADPLGPADVVVAVRVPLRRGMQIYLRAGGRWGMALPLAAVAVVVDLDGRALRCAVGGCGRALEAEHWVADHIDWSTGKVPDPRTYESFGQLVAETTRPLGDRRASADYRRHAVGVLARRALMGLL
jgi:CO/xanthine dehydrogenase FAD-binding subunit